MLKKALVLMALVGGFAVMSAEKADAAYVVRRVAPVRRVVTRTALPPYPVARHVVYGPRYYYPAPVIYGRPAYYGPGVSVSVGW